MKKYLKFCLQNEIRKKNSFSQKIIIKILKIILPMSNPDYEDKLDDVKWWMVEFDEDNVPIREIGLDENNETILKMPYKKNYGFWTDNELMYDDFIKDFSATEINQESFNEKWQELA